jgi:hypothetical protein
MSASELISTARDSRATHDLILNRIILGLPVPVALHELHAATFLCEKLPNGPVPEPTPELPEPFTDTPFAVTDLPVVDADLPVVDADFPVVDADLPVVAGVGLYVGPCVGGGGAGVAAVLPGSSRETRLARTKGHVSERWCMP